MTNIYPNSSLHIFINFHFADYVERDFVESKQDAV
jgi:hypothetical protein